MRSFKQAMKAGAPQPNSIRRKLENFLLSYRSTPHATTGRTPASLFLQRDLRTRFNLLRPTCENQVLAKQAKQVQQHDQHAQARELMAGEEIMARNYGSGDKWVPGVVIQKYRTSLKLWMVSSY